MKLEESANNYIPNEDKEENNINNESGFNNDENEQKSSNSIINMLKAQTGEGSIQSYSNHPLNMNNNNYVGQIIRGLTGMLGSLNFAILDILLGSFGFIKEKKETVNYTIEDEDIKKPSWVNGQPNV
jgi:hypothetical protein